MSKAGALDKAEALVWRCWAALGVSSALPPIQDLLIDPEGLILMTAVVADARLRDEAVDWCARHHRLIAATRLKNAAKPLTDRAIADLFAFTARVNASSPATWPSGSVTASAQRLSGKSRLSDLREPALARLRYRTLFGVGSRAEVLISLQRNQWTTISSLAEQTGYAKRIVAMALDELVLAGKVVRRQSANRHIYELHPESGLHAYAGEVASGDLPWGALADLLATLKLHAKAKSIVREIELRKRAERRGLSGALPESGSAEAGIEAFLDDAMRRWG